MPTKHFVNDPSHLVASALRSLSITNPSVALDVDNKVIYSRRTGNGGNISIISGGGSGHEPSFGAFVGTGLLTASVAGTIFASPSSKQVLAAVERVSSSRGVLVTVMNYTGDILNFGVAVEKAKARNPQLSVEMIVVGDDVGVPRSRGGKVGRRGIAGTVLVHKITGAMAVTGHSLAEVAKIGKLVSQNLVSIGVSLDRVHVPGRAAEEDSELKLSAQEVELGMGIHNEPGSGRKSGDEAELPRLVEIMLRQLLDPNDKERAFLPTYGNEMVLLINNLGALSVLELSAVVTEVTDQLRRSYNITLPRVYAGTYMTSLDGPGFSISLLNLVDTGLERTLLQLLDEPSEALGWTAPIRSETWTEQFSESINGFKATADEKKFDTSSTLTCDIDATVKHLQAGLKAVIAAEPEVTKFDSVVGDGDCGTTLRRGAEGILNMLSSPPSDIVSLLSQIAASVEDTMDGTSGILYTIFINALTQNLKSRRDSVTVDSKFWAKSLSYALSALSVYTPAKPGDRTVIDALQPFIDVLNQTEDIKKAVEAAKNGAESTRDLKASLGRSVYVGNEAEWIGKIPDPGAWGLYKFLEGLAGIA